MRNFLYPINASQPGISVYKFVPLVSDQLLFGNKLLPHGFGSWLMLTTANPAGILSCDLLQFGNRLYARTAAALQKSSKIYFPMNSARRCRFHPHRTDPRPQAGLRLDRRSRIEISVNPPAHRRLPLFFVIRCKAQAFRPCELYLFRTAKDGRIRPFVQPDRVTGAVCIRRRFSRHLRTVI